MATLGLTIGERYVLHAFVCGPGCVVPGDHMGYLTFGQILVERPSRCRYAVVGRLGLDPQVLVFDLWETVVNRLPITAPEPVLVTDDVDAAIMQTALLYKEGR